MGVLDKYRVRGNRGQLPVKGLFNPGRNQNWDWNELLQTIENNFSTDDSDLAALTARVTDNEADIVTNGNQATTNATNIATNATNIDTQNGQIEANENGVATNTANIARLCTCLTTVIEASENEAMISAWEECENNPCVG